MTIAIASGLRCRKAAASAAGLLPALLVTVQVLKHAQRRRAGIKIDHNGPSLRKAVGYGVGLGLA